MGFPICQFLNFETILLQVTHDPCAVLYVRVVRGIQITKGYYKDMCMCIMKYMHELQQIHRIILPVGQIRLIKKNNFHTLDLK